MIGSFTDEMTTVFSPANIYYGLDWRSLSNYLIDESDTFVFHPGDGHDVIYDFTATGSNHDIIQLDPALASNWTDLLSKSRQVGTDVEMTFNAHDKVTLAHVSLASLTADDVRFKS